MKRMLTLLCAAGAAALLAGCSGNEERTGSGRTISVRTATAVRRAVTRPVRTSGVLSSRSEQRLSFKTGGIVDSILVDEGAPVHRGASLATLDLAEIAAQHSQAQSAFEKATRDLGRIRSLYEDSVATLEQYQNARTGLELARAGLRIARFNLTHSRITAPSDGRVLRRFVEENEMVAPGTPVFLFGETGGGWSARVGVIDRDLVRLRIGDSASVRFDAWPDAVFSAAVIEIAGSPDPATGTYEVELALEPGDRDLASGFTAKVDIHPSETIEAMVVPIEALVDADGMRGAVFAVQPDGITVRRVPVRVLLIAGDEVAIEGAIDAGTAVVTDGAPYLIDGARIEVAR